MKRQDKSYDGGWTPRPQPPPLNRMGSFGRRPYLRPNTRPWSGQTGWQPGLVSDYAYPARRQNSGRRRPGGRGGLAGPPGDFYSSSYDDVGQGAYPDYIQPYDYDNDWPANHQIPYKDNDNAGDHSSHSKFSSPMTTTSADSGD